MTNFGLCDIIFIEIKERKKLKWKENLKKETIEKDVYIAFDGKEFEEEEDCHFYEAETICKLIHALNDCGYECADFSEIAIFYIDNEDVLKKYQTFLKDNYFGKFYGKPDAKIGKIYIFNTLKMILWNIQKNIATNRSRD